MSSKPNNRRGGGLRLSPATIARQARLGADLSGLPDVSWLDGLHVGDDQGQSSACTIFSGLKLEAIHYGNKRDFTDAECLAVYRSIIRRMGRGDDGLTFDEAFDGLRREGYLKWAKGIEQVYDFRALREGPLWYGMQVTSGIQDTDSNGCPNYRTPIDDLGLHAVVLGAAGRVERYGGQVMLTIVNSWGPHWGYKGLFQVDEPMHKAICFAMYRIVPKAVRKGRKP